MKAFCVFALLFVACGGDTFTSPDSGTDGGSDGSTSMGCPTSPPAPGSACVTTKGGPKCEYGSNPDPNCNQMFVCVSNAWVDQSTGTLCQPQSLCPTTYSAVPNGVDCANDQLSCAYPQGECICTKSFGGLQRTTPAWDCFPAQSGCPAPRPDIGSACTQQGQQCNYGACSGGVSLECDGTSWQQTFTPCPQ